MKLLMTGDYVEEKSNKGKKCRLHAVRNAVIIFVLQPLVRPLSAGKGTKLPGGSLIEEHLCCLYDGTV